MEASPNLSRDEMIADLLRDSDEIFSNPAILATAHMRTPNSGAYEQNDKLIENFSRIMDDWKIRQPMNKRVCHAG